jgi:uracil-DNA glycosylase
MVVGEAPGSDEIEQGAPFVGKSGRLLRDTMNEFGFRKENTLITNTIPCRPMDNVFPSDVNLVKSCVEKWLAEEIKLTKPKIILMIGSKPLKFVAGMDGITRMRGEWMPAMGGHGLALATFHPSYVLRKQYMADGPMIMELFRKDIRDVAVRAGFLS